MTTPIVIVTAQNTMDNAIEAMKRGAYDYVAKPFNIDEVRAGRSAGAGDVAPGRPT